MGVSWDVVLSTTMIKIMEVALRQTGKAVRTVLYVPRLFVPAVDSSPSVRRLMRATNRVRVAHCSSKCLLRQASPIALRLQQQ